jgi:hypothetical protein
MIGEVLSFNVGELPVSLIEEMMDYLANSESVEETAKVYDMEPWIILEVIEKHKKLGEFYKDTLDNMNKERLSFEF